MDERTEITVTGGVTYRVLESIESVETMILKKESFINITIKESVPTYVGEPQAYRQKPIRIMTEKIESFSIFR